MDLLALVDRLEELVGSAQKMPIGSRAIVDRRRLLDIVDQMRISIPQEVRDAQEIVANREEHRRAAEEDARLVVARAEAQAARMVEQHELTAAARKRAEEVARLAETRLEERIQQANTDIEQRITESRRIATQQMDAADEYARELLGRLDRQLQAFVRSVQSGITQLQAGSGAHPGRAADGPGAAEPLTPASPIPLRHDEPAAPAAAADDLEDLLRRRPLFAAGRPALDPAPLDPDAAAPVVIDDFAMPALDDQPTRRRDEPPAR